MFLSAGDDLACVQASLTIDNTDDHWLARLFTAEYAAQFDLFLPGLAALELPLPLGGSSNHFRTAALRKVGAWDAYNVTEDADLGVRLARFGYRSTIVRSTTYEEAPVRYGAWLRQRTRWFKGWLQTWLVHMRSPGRLLADLGLVGFVSFQLVVGGSVLAALIHPIILAALVYAWIAGLPFVRTDGVLATIARLRSTFRRSAPAISRRSFSASAAWRGADCDASPGGSCSCRCTGCSCRSRPGARSISSSARPQRWEKTEHGLARSSRRAGLNGRAALDAVFRDDDRSREFHREAAE